MKSLFQLFKKPPKPKIPVFRLRVEWNRIWKDNYGIEPYPSYDIMKQDIKKEHGYEIPDPVWVWKSLELTQPLTIKPDSMFIDTDQQNIQITLTQSARELGLTTAVEDYWVAYSFYTPVYVELYRVPEKKIENMAKCHYLYNWYHKNNKSDNSNISKF